MLKEHEFLLPSLLDRLTDLEPKRKFDYHVSYKAMNEKVYRQSVFRDILFLLNTIAFDQGFDSVLPPLISQSTLNYGIPSFSGINLSDINWYEMEKKILNCLVTFEPRLEAESLEVKMLVNENNLKNVLMLEIKGNLKMNPYPQEFLLKTDVDVESGEFKLIEV